MNELALQSQADWYCYVNGEKQGPMSAYQIETLVIGSIVGPNTLVWSANLPNWVRLGESSLRGLLDREADAPAEILSSPERAVHHVSRPPRTGFVSPAMELRRYAEYDEDMSLWQYFVRCITSQYAGFHGRARRKEYWGFTLFSCAFYFSCGALLGFMAGSQNTPLLGIIALVFLAGTAALILPTLAVGVRRLHDVGMSGWLMLIGFVPYIGSITLVVIFLLPSQSQDNQHGPVPPGV